MEILKVGRRSRPGFTMVELLTVLVIASILAGAAIPGIVTATRRAAMTASMGRLVGVIAEAQMLARTRSVPAQALANAPHFGVGIITDVSPPYATILYGTNLADEYRLDLDGDGLVEPARRIALAESMAIEIEPAQPRIGWFFQYGTGWPILNPADQSAIDVGSPGAAVSTVVRTGTAWTSYRFYDAGSAAVNPSPVCTALRMRARSGQFAEALTLYACGLVSTCEAP